MTETTRPRYPMFDEYTLDTLMAAPRLLRRVPAGRAGGAQECRPAIS